MMKIMAMLLALPVSFDLVRAYWLPIELNRAMSGHYALPIVASRDQMNKGLRQKKRDWQERDIAFTYSLRRVGEKTHLRGEAVVETRFLKYAGIDDITVSMDRDLIVGYAEMPKIEAPVFDFEVPEFKFEMPPVRHPLNPRF